MTVNQAAQEYRKQQWIQVIRDCRESGLSNREYLEQKGISRDRFYYWQRRLRKEALEGMESCGQEMVELSPMITSARDATAGRREGMENEAAIVVSGRIRIGIREGISRELLRMLLEEVRHAE